MGRRWHLNWWARLRSDSCSQPIGDMQVTQMQRCQEKRWGGDLRSAQDLPPSQIQDLHIGLVKGPKRRAGAATPSQIRHKTTGGPGTTRMSHTLVEASRTVCWPPPLQSCEPHLHGDRQVSLCNRRVMESSSWGESPPREFRHWDNSALQRAFKVRRNWGTLI